MASENRALAGPLGECCTKFVQHTGEAKGVVEELAGAKMYVSYPPTKADKYERIIFYWPDVFGPFFINSQLIMDYFASKGYLVVAVDLFFGEPIQVRRTKPNFEIWSWIKPIRERADPLVPVWVDAVKERYGLPTTKYATVGYCFGGRDVMTLAATEWLTVAAFGHPSMIDESHFKALKSPLLMACAEIDETFSRESRHRAEEILVENKADYHIQVFSKVAHGFALRGNMDVPLERWAKEQSASSIIEWFDRFCK
ncbi:alpha/beta-hydrolase [Artomyces pyxidatus]|uniref:Alpha/beta-hydrolase n=1 Tax=Artomyces pyxidatus TaxID=48021 RepID=A0ACB8TE26_9AGAM|nr:alpha/beta-hydrolase [Artomyces pyxidatus]